jgi:hypothetical protein
MRYLKISNKAYLTIISANKYTQTGQVFGMTVCITLSFGEGRERMYSAVALSFGERRRGCIRLLPSPSESAG